jgi:hypothetical protein
VNGSNTCATAEGRVSATGTSGTVRGQAAGPPYWQTFFLRMLTLPWQTQRVTFPRSEAVAVPVPVPVPVAVAVAFGAV